MRLILNVNEFNYIFTELLLKQKLKKTSYEGTEQIAHQTVLKCPFPIMQDKPIANKLHRYNQTFKSNHVERVINPKAPHKSIERYIGKNVKHN